MSADGKTYTEYKLNASNLLTEGLHKTPGPRKAQALY